MVFLATLLLCPELASHPRLTAVSFYSLFSTSFTSFFKLLFRNDSGNSMMSGVP